MASFLDGYGGYCTCTRDKCTDDCTTYRRFKPKPITNSMRIRTMTDEELAEFMDERNACLRTNLRTAEECEKYNDCKECWLDWLKQEAIT